MNLKFVEMEKNAFLLFSSQISKAVKRWLNRRQQNVIRRCKLCKKLSMCWTVVFTFYFDFILAIVAREHNKPFFLCVSIATDRIDVRDWARESLTF